MLQKLVTEFFLKNEFQSAKRKKNQTTKCTSAILKKMCRPSYIILRVQRLKSNQCCRRKFCRLLFGIKELIANSVDLDEVAHDEPPHLDLRCLQIRLKA